MPRPSQDFGASMAALATATRISPARQMLGRALKLLLLCATAALFAVWLAPPRGRPTAGRASSCESLGRGGRLCPPGAAENRAPPMDVDESPRCVSLGRGGLYCPRTSWK